MTIATIKADDTVKTVATVSVHERGLALLRIKVEKLNKRAARYGMAPLELRIVASEPVERIVGSPPVQRFVRDTWTTVDIIGCEPCINGYRLIAKVEFNDIVGNVVRIVPGNDDDGSFERYRTIEPVCEHCNSRRNRNDVFVLADSDGRRKIVGRNCLADYIRSGDANTLAAYAEIVDSFGDAGGDGPAGEGGDDDWREFTGGNGNPAMHLGAYLQIVALVKRKFGWMGRTAARDSFGGVATADDAARYIYGRGNAHERWIKENDLYPCDDDADYADRAAEWAAGLDSDGKSEYIHIIGQIARAGYVDMRKLDGYAASILIAYDKHCEREIERKARESSAQNKVWFGEEKKRSRAVRVKCIGLNSWEGKFGVTTMVRLEHYPDGVDGADKAVLVWFASGDKYNDWDLEAEYTVDFTVKGHDDHDKYGKQTKIKCVKQL
ncbi:MAG: hypothetical protein ACYS7Y_36010 [Planctomycetota bacterium]|jgi:hypothetical protein